VDGYYAFMLVATAFVLMMTVPALALFYGGMSRSKSVLNMMMMSYIAAAIVGILYVAIGWSMGFGGNGTFFANPFELLWLDGVSTSDYIYVMFQMTFAIITAALISGAVADRLKFSAWVVFVPLWSLIVYFPMAHMVFSCTDDSLICGRIGAQDYAGGTAVHINAGVMQGSTCSSEDCGGDVTPDCDGCCGHETESGFVLRLCEQDGPRPLLVRVRPCPDWP
jgi:Amt family ammonium transporter